jgi:hypothetical protein
MMVVKFNFAWKVSNDEGNIKEQRIKKLYIWNYQVNFVCLLTKVFREWSIPQED